jgi:hypothetical protein
MLRPIDLVKVTWMLLPLSTVQKVGTQRTCFTAASSLRCAAAQVAKNRQQWRWHDLARSDVFFARRILMLCRDARRLPRKTTQIKAAPGV